jgi:HPt (histidine-containing phosphotransfer) domain-containing protein
MSAPEIIDLHHLRRMTLGDRGVEREVLMLFQGQITTALARLALADLSEIASIAHALKGAAGGVGSSKVAEAAGALEGALRDPLDGGSLAAALARLTAAAVEAHTAIGTIVSRDTGEADIGSSAP